MHGQYTNAWYFRDPCHIILLAPHASVMYMYLPTSYSYINGGQLTYFLGGKKSFIYSMKINENSWLTDSECCGWVHAVTVGLSSH